jgi:hypothetical protein
MRLWQRQWIGFADLSIRFVAMLGRLFLLAVFLFASLAEPVRARTLIPSATPGQPETPQTDEVPCRPKSAYLAIFAHEDQPDIGFVAAANPVNGTDPSGHQFELSGVLSAISIQAGIRATTAGGIDFAFHRNIKHALKEAATLGPGHWKAVALHQNR